MRSAPVPDIPPIPGMNPGTVIAGGGGGGPGDGDGNGGGGDGNAGANGENGGSDATGDGQGAGACGQGGPGHCTNCGHNVAAGDPVDVVTGKVFTVPKTDLFLPGTFDLNFLRSYSSTHRGVDVGIGFGWTHSLAWTVEEHERDLVVRAGDGRVVELPSPQGEGGQVTRGAWSVMRGDGFLAVRPGNEFVHLFARTEKGSKILRLARVVYRGRGHLALQYDRGRLARVIDSVGRVILFHGTPHGRIGSIAVPDTRGHTLVFARYAYDPERGDLAAATDADGHTTRFTYDDDHRLERLEYPNGLVFRFVYDSAGRCVETWGEYAGRADPSLAGDLPRLLADGRSRAKGIHHCKLDFAADGHTEVVDSLRVRRFFGGPDG
jgi:YD repeat-containing protein